MSCLHGGLLKETVHKRCAEIQSFHTSPARLLPLNMICTPYCTHFARYRRVFIIISDFQEERSPFKEPPFIVPLDDINSLDFIA